MSEESMTQLTKTITEQSRFTRVVVLACTCALIAFQVYFAVEIVNTTFIQTQTLAEMQTQYHKWTRNRLTSSPASTLKK